MLRGFNSFFGNVLPVYNITAQTVLVQSVYVKQHSLLSLHLTRPLGLCLTSWTYIFNFDLTSLWLGPIFCDSMFSIVWIQWWWQSEGVQCTMKTFSLAELTLIDRNKWKPRFFLYKLVTYLLERLKIYGVKGDDRDPSICTRSQQALLAQYVFGQ